MNELLNWFRHAQSKPTCYPRKTDDFVKDVKELEEMIKAAYQPLIDATAVLAQKAANFDAGGQAAKDQIAALTSQLAVVQSQLDAANAAKAQADQDDADTVAALQAAVVEPAPNDGGTPPVNPNAPPAQ